MIESNMLTSEKISQKELTAGVLKKKIQSTQGIKENAF